MGRGVWGSGKGLRVEGVARFDHTLSTVQYTCGSGRGQDSETGIPTRPTAGLSLTGSDPPRGRPLYPSRSGPIDRCISPIRNRPPPPGSLSIPRHRAEVGSYGGLGSYERGTPVGLRGGPICPKAVDPLRGGPINAFRGGPLYPKAGQSTRKRAHPSRGGPIHLKESPSIRPEAVLS